MLSKLASCQGCPLYHSPYGKPEGFIRDSGEGSSGVLLILEAGGESEELEGLPVVGKAGYYLFNQLKRIGLDRDIFRIDNCVKCRPPNNKLVGMSYEDAAVAHCAPNLDATIADHVVKCKGYGKTPVILTLGKTAFKRVMGFKEKDPILRESYLNYPFWNDVYGCWVIATYHPAYLVRGYHHLVPNLQFAAQRAVELASGGFSYVNTTYLLDPDPAPFHQWVEDFLQVLAAYPETYLSYDIETPYKQGADEEKVSREEDDDYTILRCSFAHRPHEAVSIPWKPEYRPMLETLFASYGPKVGWNSDLYDLPRVQAQMTVNGDQLDAMSCWHVLNSALPKGLGYVTPFYAKRSPMWKHQASSEPAYYNACDADMALQNFLGIKQDLIKNRQWHVYERHVVELNRVLGYMSKEGIPLDAAMRLAAEVKLGDLLDGVEGEMEATLPKGVRKLKVYKKTPKDTTGMEQVVREGLVKRCSICNLINPKKAHFKAVSPRKRALGMDNICEDAVLVIRPEAVTLWAKELPWKVSKVGLGAYQNALRHRAIINRKEARVTFDEDAIKQLIKQHPSDKLYPAILKHREYQKLLGTYIGTTLPTGGIRGGMPTGKDGRIHATYTHNPSTLRLACQSPNMTNLPRAKGQDDLQTIVRNLIVAPEGHALVELDFSAIEAVLVGFFAANPDYIRLAKLGIHSFLASHVLGRPADLKWSDEDLRRYFHDIKKSKEQKVQDIYNSSKRTTHLSGYGGTPQKMHIAEPDAFPTVAAAERLQGIYFDICPYIRKWHHSLRLEAETNGFLRNPFGYVHRFTKVFKYEKIGGKWQKKPDTSGDANKVLAFLPQSTAAGIIKEAMLRLFYNRFHEAGRFLRLQVHDSLVNEVPEGLIEQVLHIQTEEMTKPISELPLPASYNLGSHLVIDVESKLGKRWGSLS